MAILFENIILDGLAGSDLTVTQCGRQECPPAHAFGPFVRDHFLMHFVLAGQGTYYHMGKAYEVRRDEGFLIAPNDETTYVADEHDPWHYIWVGFNGVLAESMLARCGLSRDNPVFQCGNAERFKTEFFAMLDEARDSVHASCFATGRLYILLAQLFRRDKSDVSAALNIFNRAVGLISRRYHETLTVERLAKALFIDRSHLFRVFKMHTDLSPSAFITDYRMKKAGELLTHTGYSITEIAGHCGYSDVCSFCKAFKKAYAVSAKAYRSAALFRPKPGDG